MVKINNNTTLKYLGVEIDNKLTFQKEAIMQKTYSSYVPTREELKIELI